MTDGIIQKEFEKWFTEGYYSPKLDVLKRRIIAEIKEKASDIEFSSIYEYESIIKLKDLIGDNEE